MYKERRVPLFHNIGIDSILKDDPVCMAFSIWSPWWWHSRSFSNVVTILLISLLDF